MVQIAGSVNFDTMSNEAYTVNRDVVFVATDPSGTIVLKTWTINLAFANSPATQTASASFTLIDVPPSCGNLSAKTSWAIRERLPVDFNGNYQAALSLVLPSGDINGSNSINALDYAILQSMWLTGNQAADINGDGVVNASDYTLMKLNWFKAGDPQ